MRPTQAASRRVVARRSAHSKGTGPTNTMKPRLIGGKASHMRAAETRAAATSCIPGEASAACRERARGHHGTALLLSP